MIDLAVTLPAPPLAAIETGLFLLAVPLILLMGIWTVITAARILLPEAPLPLDRVARSRRRGEAAPVRVREIAAEQRRQPAPAFPSASESAFESIEAALWARRN
jgi:hypothetical protein